MDKPLFSMIKKYAEDGILRMHMPGHKGKALPFFRNDAQYDITEITGFDNLHAAEGVLLSSMELAAKLWKSKKAYYLVNGSTAGILAGVRTLTKRGQKALVSRNCHKSVFNALELCGLDVRFVEPPFIEKWGIYGSVRPEDIEKILKAEKDISLLIITSPTYEGVISDLSSICTIAHKYGCRVLVDEAHGAHLAFMGEENNAIRAGADVVIQSLHKTLPCPTQTAICHIAEDSALEKEIQKQLAVFETSSPSYIFLSAIDEFVHHINNHKEEFENWNSNLDLFYNKAQKLKKLQLIGLQAENTPEIFCYDKTKLAISTINADISSSELFTTLREKYNIELEMKGTEYVLAMTGFGDNKETLLRLLKALSEIDNSCSYSDKKTFIPKINLPKLKMLLCDAREKDTALCDLTEAVGKICGEYVWAYPPGIPLLMPGEIISAEKCEYIINSQIRIFSDCGCLPSEIMIIPQDN